METTHKKLTYASTKEENTNSQIESTLGFRECRICLQNEMDSDQYLFSPCNCAGSLKYVHTTCLESWIAKMVNRNSKDIDSEKAYINCQLCHGHISFEIKKVYACKSREQAVDNVRSNVKVLIALILLLLVNIGFFFACLYYLIRFGFKTLRSNNQVLVSLLLSGEVIFSIVAFLTVFALVRKFLLDRNYTVSNIMAKEPRAPK